MLAENDGDVTRCSEDVCWCCFVSELVFWGGVGGTTIFADGAVNSA